jgi:Enoyl-(Acyl carrier protein) reductase
MVGQNHQHKRQPQSHPRAEPGEQGIIALGGKVRLGAAPPDFLGHPNPVVLDLHHRPLSLTAGAQPHLPPPRRGCNEGLPALRRAVASSLAGLVAHVVTHLKCGITPIEQQVFQGLLQVRRVALDGQGLFGQLQVNPQQGGLLYSFTKAGLLMLTRSWAHEFGRYGIRVNAIAPGLIQTEFSSYFWKNEEYMAVLRASQPIPRVGQPEEIAHAAVYLASEEASFMTGQVIVIDGGATA